MTSGNRYFGTMAKLVLRFMEANQHSDTEYQPPAQSPTASTATPSMDARTVDSRVFA
jgi:hypothetical protein